MRQFLKDNPELTEEIENKVKTAFGLIKPTDQFAEDGAEDNAESPSCGKEKAGTDKVASKTSKTDAKA